MGSLAKSFPVQLYIWVEKKPDMTREEFSHYWKHVHGAKFLEFPAVQEHCLKYEQFHLDPELQSEAEAEFSMPHSSWDGLAILTFDSVDGVRAVWNNQEFAQWAADDEPKFCNYPGITKRYVVSGKPYTAHEQ